MSGQWLFAFAIALPLLIAVCLVLERISLGWAANLAVCGLLGAGALTLGMLALADIEARSDQSRSTLNTPLDIRLAASPRPPIVYGPPIAEERILAAPSKAPPPAIAVVRSSGLTELMPDTRSNSPPLRVTCPAAPSLTVMKRNCAVRLTEEVETVRRELRVGMEGLRQEVLSARAQAAKLAEELRQRDAALEKVREQLAGQQAELADARAASQRQQAARAAPEPVTAPAPPPAISPPKGPAAPPPSVSAAPAQYPIKQQLDGGVVSAAYTLQPMQLREVVTGEIGSYYLIRLRYSDDGKPILFDPGSYALNDRPQQIESAVRRFRDEILASLPKSVPHRLFLQAFATSSKFARPRMLPTSDTHLTTVDVLSRRGAGRFDAAIVQRSFAKSYSNDDLPVLRAAYAANLLGKSLGQTPTLLDGGIRGHTETQPARAFELVLLVKW